MKRRAWVGALVLSLGGWASGLFAQEAVWRPVRRPPRTVALSGAELEPCPAVVLGRPEPLAAPLAGDRRAGQLPPTGVVPVGYQVRAPLPPAPGRPAPDVIAAGPPPAGWPEEGEEAAAPFAVERPPAGRRPAYLPAPGPAHPAGAAPVVYKDWASGPTPVDDPPPWAYGGDEAFGGRTGPRLYLRAEYLLWWAKDDHVPPLVSSGTPDDQGILGRPSTRVLFGGDGLDQDPRSGGRFTAGYFLDDCGDKFFEVSGFFLGQRSARFTASSAMNPVLARPFFNLNGGAGSSQIVASPGVSTGSISVNAPSNLWGLQANLGCNLCCGCNYAVRLLGGFRYLDLDESLTVTENIQGLAGAPPPFTNASVSVFDRFATHNQFYGGQAGLEGRYRVGRWSLDGRITLALGGTHQSLTIDGMETLVAPDGTVRMFRGGLLALPSNIGHFSQNRFSVVPEVGINLGYQLTDRVRAFAGYNFLYWSNVVRPGEQIDPVLDITQIPNFAPPGTPSAGQNRPRVSFKESDFWAQGLTFGLEFTY
jgi:hypothetical protein